MNNRYKGFSTKAIHTGQAPEAQTGAVIVPIFQTSTYAQSSPGQHKGYEYSRTQNPTRHALEACLADLESAKFGLAFGSGLAAITTVMHLLPANSHVICCDDVYGGTQRLFRKVLEQRSFSFSFVDLRDIQALKNAITERTKMVWIETPTNPLLKIIDLEKVAMVCKSKNILTVVDNTFLSPYLQRPIELGCDVVMHSTTKYIGGHSDVVGGALVVKDSALASELYFLQNAMGAIPGPMDAWLTLRGLKTLAVRMQRHCENAMKVATFLQNHKKVKSVIYPGLVNHPEHELAKKQMHGFGGMISCVLNLNLEKTKLFLSRLKIFTLAESLGGVESLIEHPAIMTHASVPKDIRETLGIGDGFIRLSVGIEDVHDLIDDLDMAFSEL